MSILNVKAKCAVDCFSFMFIVFKKDNNVNSFIFSILIYLLGFGYIVNKAVVGSVKCIEMTALVSSS